MLRMSVTHLEALRYFKSAEDATIEKLLHDLAGDAEPTRKMQAGKVMAKFWEHAKEGEMDAVTVDGWRINFDLDAAVSVPPVREMKVEYPMLTPSGPVVLVGKCDGLEGVTVHDQKLTEKLDAERNYLDSLQWRAYLVMFGARKFVYDVFVGDVGEHEDVITVSEYHPLTFYTYPGIEKDVQSAVDELAEIMTRWAPQIAALKEARAK